MDENVDRPQHENLPKNQLYSVGSAFVSNKKKITPMNPTPLYISFCSLPHHHNILFFIGNILVGQRIQRQQQWVYLFPVTVGDINNDMYLDVILCLVQIRQIIVFLGSGDGSFKNPLGCPVDPLPTSIALGDFNMDDRLDFGIVASEDNIVVISFG